MTICHIPFSRPLSIVFVAGISLGCGTVFAASKTAPAGAQARYLQERSVCLKGLSNQDRATCLREASAAFAEARRGGLGVGAQPYERNAHRRCEQLPDDDRRACDARMQGQGSTSGSASAGGLYRELVTPGPIAPNASQPAGSAPLAPTR